MGQTSERAKRVFDTIVNAFQVLFGMAFFFAFLFVAAAFLNAWLNPPTSKQALQQLRNTPAQSEQDKREKARKEKTAQLLFLCEQAAACKKYETSRLECATAGNLKTCLRIKMGEDDAVFTNLCSGFDPGAPTITLPRDTPNAVQCFFLSFTE